MKKSRFNTKRMNKLKVEKAFQYLKMNFGELMADITPAWKMRKLHLWWYHKVHGNAFRRILEINRQLFEYDSVTYNCNMCGKVVFKGSIKYGIILNCPNCGHVFCIKCEHPHKFNRLEHVQCASSRKTKVDENSEIFR